MNPVAMIVLRSVACTFVSQKRCNPSKSWLVSNARTSFTPPHFIYFVRMPAHAVDVPPQTARAMLRTIVVALAATEAAAGSIEL